MRHSEKHSDRWKQLFGPPPPADFEDNGCTMSPDGWWYLACRWHDWAYSGLAGISRLKADWYLFKNMRLLGCPPITACIYFLAVRCFGRRFFGKK